MASVSPLSISWVVSERYRPDEHHRASHVFHPKFLHTVLRASVWWFEGHSIGVIMNHFFKERSEPSINIAIPSYSTPIMLAGFEYDNPLLFSLPTSFLAFLFPIVIVYWFVLRFYHRFLQIWVTLRKEIASSMIVFVLVMLMHTKLVSDTTQFPVAIMYASILTYIMYLLPKSAADAEAEAGQEETIS
ncbi:hypothetical protein BU15DRAFT_78126 [Melanogaster broomeanus]|nr:hypothetical protein BU15DRAFT_78126 [Melanogaster broomeanus]